MYYLHQYICDDTFFMKPMQLYDYQQEMVERILSVLSEPGKHRYVDEQGRKQKLGSSVMVQMPTGTGKTVVLASLIVKSEEGRVNNSNAEIWIVAHRRELVEQIENTVERMLSSIIKDLSKIGGPSEVSPDCWCGVNRHAWGEAIGARIQVYSIQWLNRHLDEIKTKPSLIIIDEAHHALAPIYQNVLASFPQAMKLGMTATPCRLKAQSFSGIFDTLLTSWPTKKFIEKGYLSPYDYVVIGKNSETQIIIDSLQKRAADGDYNIAEMDERLNVEPAIKRLYASLVKYAKGKKGIVYAIDIAHAKAITEYYCAMGLHAVALDAKTPAKVRKELIERFKEGKGDILVNVNLFDEGFDCPDVEFIQIARPTLSLSKYLQMVGRGLRTHKGKKACMILDNVGVYRNFGAPDKDRDWQRMFYGVQAGKGVVRRKDGVVRKVALSEDDMQVVVSHELKQQDAKERKRLLAHSEPFELNGRWGLKSGDKVLLQPIYRRIYPFVGNYAKYELAPGMCGVLDRGGHPCIGGTYKDIELFPDGTCIASVNMIQKYKFKLGG